jgi:hypothetical protein
MNMNIAIQVAGEPEAGREYDRPILVPIGNLHDLLMGASGGLCDALDGTFDNLTQTGVPGVDCL